MAQYVILTNRKRAIIALVHTVAFLGIAAFTGVMAVRPLHRGSSRSAWMLAAVYLVVSAVLLVLTAISGTARERLYFAFCAGSAGTGLERQLLGDGPLHLAVYARVVMLLCAVVACAAILRGHSSEITGPESP